MAQQEQSAHATGSDESSGPIGEQQPVRRRAHEANSHQLSPLLVWAVVFCDIGTSVYYVPGILYSQVGALTPFFVFLTTVGFLLLSVKYVEISWRNPEGEG